MIALQYDEIIQAVTTHRQMIARLNKEQLAHLQRFEHIGKLFETVSATLKAHSEQLALLDARLHALEETNKLGDSK